MLFEFMQENSPLKKEIGQEVFSQIEESFFDQVACYFPINFKPMKNVANPVSPDDLRDLHQKCMLVSPCMINHFVPFLLEKLSAKQIETKVQSLVSLHKIV
jgi:hypothetical protein